MYEGNTPNINQKLPPKPQNKLNYPGISAFFSKMNIKLDDLKKLDFYTKVDEDHSVQTSTGAILSIGAMVIIIMLVFSEVSNHFFVSQSEHMVVDTTLNRKLKIDIDITFHALTCKDVHLDTMDVAGDNQVDLTQNIFKTRLSENGVSIGDPVDIGAKVDRLPSNYCGDCFGAATNMVKCCNTCEELKRAYQVKGWSPTAAVQTSEQCLRSKNDPFNLVVAGEGCRLKASLEVNKIAGNFHIAHGNSVVRDGAHIHQFVPHEAPKFNCSHTIHDVRFGESYYNMKANPLDNTIRKIDSDVGTGLFQYFIKLVPTVYSSGSSSPIVTNEYTLTERFRPLLKKGANGNMEMEPGVLPGIFFIYELSPFMKEVTSTAAPLSHLLTRLVAVVGGVFALSGLIDVILYRFDTVVNEVKSGTLGTPK